MNSKRRRFPHKLLIFGISFLLIGFILLLATTGYLPGLIYLWPVLLIVFGLLLIYLVIINKGWESYVFVGMIFTLSGIFFLLMNTVMTDVGMERIWPIFMLITGVSLFAYGMQKEGNTRLSLVMPAIMIVFLSLVFLPFSLNWVKQGFVSFVVHWWPALFILAGLALIVSFFLHKRTGSLPVENEGNEPEDIDEIT